METIQRLAARRSNAGGKPGLPGQRRSGLWWVIRVGEHPILPGQADRAGMVALMEDVGPPGQPDADELTRARRGMPGWPQDGPRAVATV